MTYLHGDIALAETQLRCVSDVCIMGKEHKQLKREVRKCLRGEKENQENELCKDMFYFKREFATPLFNF